MLNNKVWLIFILIIVFNITLVGCFNNSSHQISASSSLNSSKAESLLKKSINENSIDSSTKSSKKTYSSASSNKTESESLDTKSYPTADVKDLPRTYVTEPTETNKQKLYVIKKRTEFVIGGNPEVVDFYNDVPYLYACIKYTKEGILQLIDKNSKFLVNTENGNKSERHEPDIYNPLHKCDFWNIDFENLEYYYKNYIPPQGFYNIVDINNLNDITAIKVLPSGQTVTGIMTYRHKDPANMYIVKQEEDYLVYISYECDVAHERKLDGKLVKGTYGE